MTINGRALRRRTYTPKFNGNDEAEHPMEVVFLAPSRGAMSRLQRLRMEGVEALRAVRGVAAVGAALASGQPDADAAERLADTAGPLEAWQARMDEAHADFGRSHIVEIRGLTLDADDRAWMVEESGPDAGPALGQLEEKVEFIRLLPALWSEVVNRIHDAGILGADQGKG